MINNILLVGLGGGLGSIARYLCQRWMLMAVIRILFPLVLLQSILLAVFSSGFSGVWLLDRFKVMKTGNYF